MITDLYKKLKSLNIKIRLSGQNLDIEADQGVLTPALINEIKLHKTELIDLIKQHHVDSQDSIVIPEVAVATDYSLSYSQRRMWLLSQDEASSQAYHISSGAIFENTPDRLFLEQTLSYLVERHESLRTVFRENESGEIRQLVLASSSVLDSLPYSDLSDSADPKATFQNILAIEEQTFFDLSRGPLFRLHLVKLQSQEHVLLFTLHHIISDGWSMQVLQQEFLEVYGLLKAGLKPSLSPLRIQYKDYSLWQTGQLSDSAPLKESALHWQEQFSGELPVLNLPTDHTRPSVKSYNGGVVSRLFSAALSAQLKSYCLSESGTLFMGLLTIVNALLYRYTSQTDIIIGSPVAGRLHGELENQIGLYVNTIALRTTFSGSDSFRSLFCTTKGILLDGYAHESYPFDVLVDSLGLERDMSRNPLFDVMVILQNQSDILRGSDILQQEGIQVKAFTNSVRRRSAFDLSFEFSEQSGCILLNLNYNSDLYEESTIERMLSHTEQLLASALDTPDLSLSLLDYLSKSEKRKLLEDFNATAMDYPRNKTLIDLFEEQVEKSPDTVAVVFGDVSLTYCELNEKSNQLAYYLMEQYSVGSGDLVCLQPARNEWMVVVILSVMKAGCVYVPIDDQIPDVRRDYIVSNSGCKLLLDQYVLSSFQATDKNYSSANPCIPTDSQHIFTVIYTTGSTGIPKGIELGNTNILNRLYWMWEAYPFATDEVCSIKTSIGFVDHLWELFGPLLKGISSVIFDKALLLDIPSFISALGAYKVSRIVLVPSLLREILSYRSVCREQLGMLKYWTCSGEALSEGLVKLFYETFTTHTLLNIYGSTEVTADVTFYDTSVHSDSALSDRKPVAIGKPIWNTQIYILDVHGQLCPVGITGEICICGAGLSYGYLNQPELTSEKFVPNPFKSGEKLYKTGDSGKWLSDGNVEYLGRMDHQVKIRGNRVELGEIERVLLSHAKIREAVVVAGDDKEGATYLACYFVSTDTSISVDLLRLYLGDSLPNYMIPGYFVALDALPLTHNGKIDRKLLPVPELSALVGSVYVGARNETETKLVKIWEELLGREKIGVHDNFFALGGHSLKVVQLTSRIQKELNVKINVKDLFSLKTIEKISNYINTKHNHHSAISILPVQKYYDTSYRQNQEWKNYQNGICNNLLYTKKIKNLQFKELQEAIYDLAERHEALRTGFTIHNNELKQIIKPADEIVINILHVQADKENEDIEIEEIKKKEQTNLFDLSIAPIFKIIIVNKEYLILNIHHIIVDEWSMEIIERELNLLYVNRIKKALVNTLPKQSIHYKDYIAHQNNWLRSNEGAIAENYWQTYFSEPLPAVPWSIICHNRPDFSNGYFVAYKSGSTYKFTINKKLIDSLKRLSEKTNISFFSVIMSSFILLTHKINHSEDIIISCPIIDREDESMMGIVGWMMKGLILRTKITDEMSVINLLNDVFNNYINSAHYCAYPVGKLKIPSLTASCAIGINFINMENVLKEMITDFSSVHKQEGVPYYPINAKIIEKLNGIEFNIIYRTDMFSEKSIENLFEIYLQILNLLSENTDKSINSFFTNLDIFNDQQTYG